MTTRIESIINPLRSVRDDLTLFQRASIELGRIFQQSLGLGATDLEKLEIEVSLAAKPKIVLKSMVFADGEWEARGVQIITQRDREWSTTALPLDQNGALQKFSSDVLQEALKVDRVVVSPATIPALLERDTPVIIAGIKALRAENGILKEELAKLSGQTGALDDLRRQLDAQKQKESGLQDLHSQFKRLGRIIGDLLHQEGWPCPPELVSSFLFNLVSLNLDVREPFTPDQLRATLVKLYKDFGIHQKKHPIDKMIEFMIRKQNEDVLSPQRAFDRFAKGKTDTRRGINQILEWTKQDNERILGKIFNGSFQTVEDIFKNFPWIVANLIVLQDRLEAIKVMYMALQVNRTAKPDEIDIIDRHIDEIFHLNPTLGTIKELLHTLLKQSAIT